MHFGGAGQHAGHDTRLRVHADVRFHAEMPLIAFLRATHLGIAAARLVLGARRRRNERGVHQASGLNLHALLRQMLADAFKKRRG